MNENPPAFPMWLNEGMTLRDYFAAAVMQGYSANPETILSEPEKLAHWAYKQADAMLKAR